MKLKTVVFQEMMSRAVKGVGNNKLIPLTSLLSIKLVDGDLVLTSTDSTNYLYIRQAAVDGDDMEVVVQADTLAKLVAKMTSEEITLTLKNNYLEVKGNGTYKIDIPLDENGEFISYPDPYGEIDLQDVEEKEIQYTAIKNILTSVKPAIAVTMEDPEYTGYYVGESVLGTNRELINNYDVNLFGQTKLVPPELMNLLEVMSKEKFVARIKDNVLVFESDDCVIYGKEMEGIEDYQSDAILGIVNTQPDSMVKIGKQELLQVLDRLSLFTSDYEGQTIRITISGNAFQISSPTSTGIEVIEIVEQQGETDFTTLININYLANEVKVQAGDVVELWYSKGSPSIKLVDGKLTEIIALVADSEKKDEA